MQSDRIGKYRIIAKLGQGGMATVYLSVVPGPAGVNKLLVVKLLKDDLSSDSDFLSMFLNEARLAARLNHANVVHTYEVGVEGQQHFLAMDYLDGQPLHALLRKATRAKMPLDVHVRILADMLAGLDYAHTLKDFDGTPLYVVHRDVSPQNVFVTYDGQVKVVDFGIAKAAGAVSTTQSGVFKGKLAYVAPEQAGGDPVDARADLFSVGVMLWEAMAGRRFAQGDSQTAVLARRLSGSEPRIRDVVPDADPELADICDKAMAHDAWERFATAREFQDALEGFLDRFSRRIGRREVGDMVTALFGEEREKIRQIIDEQMKRLLRETSTALPMPTLEMVASPFDPTPITTVEGSARNAMQVPAPPSTPSLATPTDGGVGSLSASHGTLVAANISRVPPASPGKGRAVLIGLGALALASLIGIGVVLTMKKPTADAKSAATPAPTATAAAATDRVKISVTFGPEGAVAKLDGVPLQSSPFTAQVPRDGSMHRIDVEGPGLMPKTTMVSYDKDVSVDVVLEAGSPELVLSGAPSASAPPVDTVRRPGGGGRLPDTTKNPKQPREIDEADPYKKK
jgi:serine/threonine-protein kinase